MAALQEFSRVGKVTIARARALRHPAELVLYGKLRRFTMISPRYFLHNLHIARFAAGIPGDIVECGTWRGGMSAGMAATLPGRRSVLFDSFQGLPDAKDIDGSAALDWSTNVRSYDNCTADERSAHEAMRRVGQSDYQVIAGWFDDTVGPWAEAGRDIAVLRLDCDWYDSMMTCLHHLWPLVRPGGVVILDDYYTWDGNSRAVHEYLATTKAAERIHELDGVAFLTRL